MARVLLKFMGNTGGVSMPRCTGAGLVVDFDRIKKSNAAKSVQHDRNAKLR
jgi:hypothetical protein